MRDRVKRMLGFVLVATVIGPPRSPRQTHFRAHGCNRGSATTTGSRTPAFHPLWVAGQAMGTHFRGAAYMAIQSPERVADL
jgi:hypothetical protein